MPRPKRLYVGTALDLSLKYSICLSKSLWSAVRPRKENKGSVILTTCPAGPVMYCPGCRIVCLFSHFYCFPKFCGGYYFRFIVWHPRRVISSANASIPFCLMYLMQAGRSELNSTENTFPMKFEYVLHSFTSMLHSAQVLNPLSMQHCLILHHDAFSFFMHPGHLPDWNFRHAPQYRPHAAIFSFSGFIF